MRQLVFLVLAGLLFPQTQTQQATGSIRGTVVIAGTTEGISGVVVTLSAPGATGVAAGISANVGDTIARLVATAPANVSPAVIAQAVAALQAQAAGAATGKEVTATTDASGVFKFSDLVPGSYVLRAQREGYFAASIAGVPGTSTIASATANVDPKQPTPDVVMGLLRGGIISGRVRDANGQPSSGLSVAAYRVDYRDGRPFLSTVNSKTTDDRGEYRLFWLPPGQYYVGVVPRRLINGSNPSQRTFFPNVVDPKLAVPLAVGGGSELPGTDIQIQTAPVTVSVSGTAVIRIPTLPQISGGPAFYLVSADPRAFSESTTPTIPNSDVAGRASGRFELKGIVPGSYDLIGTMLNAQGRSYPAKTHIEVGNQDLSGVTLAFVPGVDVRARVVFEGFSPASPVVRLNLRSRELFAAPFDSAVNAAILTAVTVGGVGTPPPAPGTPAPIPFLIADGTFLFPNVPAARYGLQATSIPANTYVADIRMAGGSVYDSGFTVGSDASPSMDVVIRNDGGTIRGSVRDAKGLPATAGRVVLVPQESRRINAALFKVANIVGPGAFTMGNVPPGDYKLFAWEFLNGNIYMNAEFLAAHESRGTAVHVSSAGVLEQNLVLIPAEK